MTQQSPGADTLADGPDSAQALGRSRRLGTVNGVRVVGHGAGAPGVGAAIDIYPDLGHVVVVLANYDGAVDPVRDRTRGS
jgi:hypothetical protein